MSIACIQHCLTVLCQRRESAIRFSPGVAARNRTRHTSGDTGARRPAGRAPASTRAASPDAGVWRRAAAILLAGTATYWNSLQGPFVFDDTLSIVGNPYLRAWWSLASLFPGRELPASGRPIANLSFGVNYAIGGLDVVGYHVLNIAIHLTCALLVFGVVRRTLQLPKLRPRFGERSADLAFATALIWTLHPLNTEVVDYVTERMESLMAVFYLLTIYASIRARQSDPPRARLSVSGL